MAGLSLSSALSLSMAPYAVGAAPTPPDAQRVNATRAASLMPAQEGLVHGNLYAFTRPGLRNPTDTPLRNPLLPQGAGTPQFLLRQ